MAVKSSRRRALRDFKPIEARASEPRWELDDLEASELDLLLSSADDVVQNSAAVENESKNWRTASSTTPPKEATKHDYRRLFFFDLPAEIRVQLYQRYCQALHDHFGLPDNRLPVRATDVSLDYSALLLKAQLICHQMRTEFIPVWAQSTVFVTERQSFASSNGARMEELRDIWFSIRELLQWLGPVARREARTLRLSCIWKVTDLRSVIGLWPPPQHIDTRILRPATGEHLAAVLERFEDVHEDLRVEVELRCEWSVGSDVEKWRATRRIFTLRQRARGVAREDSTADWTCDIGSIQTIKIDRATYDSMRLPLVGMDWQFVRDELWKAVDERQKVVIGG